MAQQEELDWSLNEAGGRVILVAGSDRFDLGERDAVFVRLADFMGDGFLDPEDHDVHEAPGDFGERK
jgi:hypothetical protein